MVGPGPLKWFMPSLSAQSSRSWCHRVAVQETVGPLTWVYSVLPLLVLRSSAKGLTFRDFAGKFLVNQRGYKGLGWFRSIPKRGYHLYWTSGHARWTIGS